MLKIAQKELGWPSEVTLFNPPGSGAAIVAELARNKIQARISRLEGGQNVRVGILTSDPHSSSTQSPLALVCEFHNSIPLATLHELHNLAWNFSRTPLLVTIEPNRLRAFSCCELPERDIHNTITLKSEIVEAEYNVDDSNSLSSKAAAALHWINLSCGVLQRRYPKRFDRRYTADNSLLDNLVMVRQRLHEAGLEFDLIHDLLARMIFIQFLFQRCDKNGVPALNPSYLKRLHDQDILSSKYKNLGDILGCHRDTYALFKYLNNRFNGDLFTGKAESKSERVSEWRKEMKFVRKEHLSLLRGFVLGEMEIKSGQQALWPLYSFDTIPLEFVSSIYESFVTKRTGTVYTPVHLVDFVLDGVLPWEGTEWDLKILDPACGSGIFLVRAFQRLVHRWKNANPNTPVRTEILKRLLVNNLMGVDIDEHAIRVASFSLYLAMCDELDPRHYWKQIHFPKLRGTRLITSDFFSEEVSGFKTEVDSKSYDLVIGNPPWGKNQIKDVFDEFGSDAAAAWSKKHEWPISYGDPGTLFVAKAAKITKPDGRVSLLQPSGTLLLNQSGPAIKQRQQLFSEYRVEEVVNLSALRFGLFKKAVGPSSLITLKPEKDEQEYTLNYIVVKPGLASDNDYRFVIDPYDVHEIYSSDAENNPLVWTALTWGGPRDLALLKYLSRFSNIRTYEDEGILKTRWGVVRGNRKKEQPSIVGRRFFSEHDFPDDSIWSLNSHSVPINDDPNIHSRDSSDFSPFDPPQLIIKRSWRRETGRFRAVRVLPEEEGILCSNSYVTVSGANGGHDALNSACLALNSRLATYYLLLTSAQFSNYRDTTNVSELLSVPCPPVENVFLKEPKSYEDVDTQIQEAFELKESEQALIDDLFEITLPYFKEGLTSKACYSTHRSYQNKSDDLLLYCQWFLRVLSAMFGEDKSICATIFEESNNQQLPIRLIGIHLEWPGQQAISVESFNEGKLSDKLTQLYTTLSGKNEEGPTCYKRVARIFETIEIDNQKIPTIFIAKPDEMRYWSRSIAMRDADEIASEIMAWNESTNRDKNAGFKQL